MGALDGKTIHVTGTISLDLEITVEGEQPPEPPPDDPFVVGVTEPTAEGGYTPSARCLPRVPETSMLNYDGDITNVADGEVLDRLIITGQFKPDAVRWVLRDSIVEGGPAPSSMYPLIDVRGVGADGGRVEFTEVRPTYNGYEVYGVKGGNVTLYRSTIRGVVDGLQPHGSGTYPNTTDKVVRVQGTLIEDLAVFNDPGQSDDITHNDGLQASGALSYLEVFGSALHGGRTSCILLQQNSGLYGNVVILRNWLYGHPDSGSTFNTSQNGRGPLCASGLLIVAGNRFSKAGNTPHALVSKSTLDSGRVVWVRNVYMEDGSPVQPSQGADRTGR